MSLQNIGAANSDDAFYRYKMPRMSTKIEGRGNGIKTNVVNMVDIAKALARPASYTTKYFGCELGAQSKFDEKNGVSLVNGAHDTAKLAALLENFIKKYVQCYGCGNPETEILITKTQMITLKCAACGYLSDVDMSFHSNSRGSERKHPPLSLSVSTPPERKEEDTLTLIIISRELVGPLKSTVEGSKQGIVPQVRTLSGVGKWNLGFVVVIWFGCGVVEGSESRGSVRICNFWVCCEDCWIWVCSVGLNVWTFDVARRKKKKSFVWI